MLKKRIVVTAIAFSLCLPSLSSAAPLSWTPRADLLASLSRLWDLLPGAHHVRVAPSARAHQKNGCGMDPTGICPAPSGSGATSPEPVDGQ